MRFRDRLLVKLIKNKPAIGWVRGNLVPEEGTAQEILKLKKLIENLELEKEMQRNAPPRGTEDLSQGEDKIIVPYTYDTHENISVSGANTKRHRATLVTTWNDLFSKVAPAMMSQASEQRLREVLNYYIRAREQDKINSRHVGVLVSTYKIDPNAFQTFKLQLRSLGLITKVERSQAANEDQTYWTLTPYGDNLMTQLRAVRKNENRIKAEGDT